jgi:hypothetical protein
VRLILTIEEDDPGRPETMGELGPILALLAGRMADSEDPIPRIDDPDKSVDVHLSFVHPAVSDS